MEENEIVEPVEQTEEEYLQCEVEVSPYNKNERFIPTEYHYDVDFQKSWKKCHCGKKIWYNANYCQFCGQKVGKPDEPYEERKE